MSEEKELKKRIISLMLAVVLVFAVFPFYKTTIKASSNMTLGQLQAKFPNGKYWNHVAASNHNADYCTTCNNPDGWTSSPCYQHPCSSVPVGSCDCNRFGSRWQCCGFANKLGYDAYGSVPDESWTTVTTISGAISVVKAGDVIHYTGNGADATYGHWVFVIGVS